MGLTVMIRSRFAAAAAAVALTLTACSEADEVPQAQPEEAAASTASGGTDAANELDRTIEAYFEAYASQDPATMEKARQLAASGSIAEAYIVHQAALANSLLDAGNPQKPEQLNRTDDGFEICAEETDNDNPCATYTAVKARGDKIASFKVNGKALKDRILVGSGEIHDLGRLGSVELLSAYQSASDTLFVELRIKSKVDGIAVESRTAYRSAEGRQSQHQSWAGPQSLLSDSTGYYSLTFPKVGLGGVLHLEMFAESGAYDSAAVDIPLR